MLASVTGAAVGSRRLWGISGLASATTVGSHLPGATPRSDEAKCVCGGRIAENIRVVGRIDSYQAARDHIPTVAVAAVAISCRRRSGAENAQGGGDCKRDESLVSDHGGLLLIRADYLSIHGDKAFVALAVT